MLRSVVLQRTLGILAAIVLTAGAVYFVYRITPDAGSQTQPRTQARPNPTTTTARPSSSPLPTGSNPTGGTARAATGPGLTTAGVHVLAEPDTNGNLEVVERVRLNVPVTRVRISPPQVAGVRGLEDTRPAVQGLQAEADGAPVPVTLPTPLLVEGLLTLPEPATNISLRYRLEGAAARSQPSPIGRVLIALPPIAAQGLGDLPVVVEVVGPGVRNLVCTQLPDAGQLCGRQSGAVWSTTPMAADHSFAVAQFDLPQPGAG